MANISYNKIHETLDEATMTAILTKLNEIRDFLPKGTLTKEQRQQYRGLDVRNLSFVEDAVRAKNGYGGSLLSPALNNDTLDTDLALFKQMNTLRQRLKNLETMFADVERIVAHEAYGTALLHYKFYQMGSKAGVPNAKATVEELEWRFKKQGPNKGKRPGAL